MWVTIHVNKHFGWVPVPKGVKVTKAHQEAGLVIPNQAGDGFLTKVTRHRPSQTSVPVNEATLLGRLVHEAKDPAHGGTNRLLTRSEALAELIAMNVMPLHAPTKHIRGFTVECDDGPDEKLFEETVLPLTKLTSGRTGQLVIDPEDYPEMLKRYLQPATHLDHGRALHKRHGVKGEPIAAPESTLLPTVGLSGGTPGPVEPAPTILHPDFQIEKVN